MEGSEFLNDSLARAEGSFAYFLFYLFKRFSQDPTAGKRAKKTARCIAGFYVHLPKLNLTQRIRRQPKTVLGAVGDVQLD